MRPGDVQKQASMISLMLGNSMGMGQLTEAGLIQIVEGSGGGYVGGCAYLSLPDNPPGGLPGPWLSPVHAPCTGAAALAASGWISVNPTLGG
jgi:hypothetical protein